jgi:hypothetical protein
VRHRLGKPRYPWLIGLSACLAQVGNPPFSDGQAIRVWIEKRAGKALERVEPMFPRVVWLGQDLGGCERGLVRLCSIFPKAADAVGQALGRRVRRDPVAMMSHSLIPRASSASTVPRRILMSAC